MKMMLLLTSFILIFVSCNNREAVPKFDNLLVADFGPNDTLFLADIVDSSRVISLEVTDKSVIGEMIRVTHVDDGFLIYGTNFPDRHLYLFDDTGKFIRTIGTIGRGPEEFIALTSYVYDAYSGIIHIYDQTQQAIYKYRIDGSFIEKLETGLIIEDFTISNSGNYILYGSFESLHPETGKKLPKGIYLADKNGKFLSVIDTIDSNDKYQFFGQLFFTRSEPNSTLISSFDDNIYGFDDDAMIEKFKIDFGTRTLSQKDRLNTDMSELSGEFIIGKLMPSENNRFIIYWGILSGQMKGIACFLDKEAQTCNLYKYVVGSSLDKKQQIIGGSGNELFASVKFAPKLLIDTEGDPPTVLEILYTKQ